MSAKVTSIGLKGLEGFRVNVEVGTFVGNDSIKIVGLPDAAVKESKLRILAALRSLGYNLSGQNIIINLSPAEQKKDFRSLKGKTEESSQTVRKRVESARERQYDRYGEEICNSRVPYEVLVK
ncbi:magnesium chelatase domain-containing protein [Bacillus salipaludis]|uniref:Magnesium chelatase domain-containing protein n=1 Tax=Bacillus salipaludis TaxID=2547811 RepID=A0AA90R091_9BACI|nr:magnesium chelatase domain-containing protein [Bacillus salipaludis]MDQ6600409.1 magnesium chelatase domain-containing protein [Bacillus salipaludis]